MTKSSNAFDAKYQMPTFQINTMTDDSGNVIPGIKRMLDVALAIKDSVMLWGPMGVGKSQGIAQWNEEKVAEYAERIANGEKVKPWNPVMCDVRLSMKEPVDMVGVPIPVKDEKTGKMSTVWATPSMWPKDDGEFSGGVILLDEMNQGQPAILNAAFQLVQDRRLGDYKVPEGYIIIGASNPSAFNASVTEFSLPLANRFSHFNVGYSLNAWVDHRVNNGGNVDVISFLKTRHPDMLFDEKTCAEKVGGDMSETLFTDIVTTPRSWEVVEKVLALPDNQFTMTEKRRYCTGRLGLMLVNELFNYLDDKMKYQSWEEILIGKKNFRSEDAEQFWAVQLSCIQAIVQEEDDTKKREYILNFVEATRHLKSTALRAINTATLARTKKIANNPKVFNIARDAQDLLQELGTNLRMH